MIVIIDYDVGNLGSILNMLKKIGQKAKVSSKKEDIIASSKLIIPGVGAFDQGMTNLQKMEMIPILNEKVLNKRNPVLGICLGMQLFTCKSEEGILPGLGWIDANTVKLNGNIKIPHMGWNEISIRKKSSILTALPYGARFYFVHSYHVVCNNSDDILLSTKYGNEFISAFQKENIFGVQFHPEKSHKFGMQFLKNFCSL